MKTGVLDARVSSLPLRFPVSRHTAVRFAQSPWDDSPPALPRWRPKPVLTRPKLVMIGLVLLGLFFSEKSGVTDKAINAGYSWMDPSSRPPLDQISDLHKALLQNKMKTERLAKGVSEKRELALILTNHLWDSQTMQDAQAAREYQMRIKDLSVDAKAETEELSLKARQVERQALEIKVLMGQIKDPEERKRAGKYASNAEWAKGVVPLFQKEADASLQSLISSSQSAISLSVGDSSVPPRTPQEIRKSLIIAASAQNDAMKALVEKTKADTEKLGKSAQYFAENEQKYILYRQEAIEKGDLDPNDPHRPYKFGVDRWFDKMQGEYQHDMLKAVRGFKAQQLEAREAVKVVQRYADQFTKDAETDKQAKPALAQVRKILRDMERQGAEIDKAFASGSATALNAKHRLVKLKEGSFKALRTTLLDSDIRAEVAGK